MLQQKRDRFHRGLQREEREKIFQRIRLELMGGQSLPSRGSSEDGQQDILDSIGYFLTQEQPIDFIAINAYICDFEGPFRPQLAEQLLPLVLEKFTSNYSAIACAANLLSKCQQGESIVNCLRLKQALPLLLQGSGSEDKMETNSALALAFLLYQLLRLASDKTLFAGLPEHYGRIMHSAGQFHVVTLLLLAEGSCCRALMPPHEVVKSYLAQDIPYEKLQETGVIKLHEMVDNCLRFDQTRQLYQPASHWIERRLKQRAYPLSLKPELVQLMTMIVNSMQPSFLDFLQDLSIFREIMFLARFGPLNCKPPALDFVATLVEVAEEKLLIHYVEQQQLLQVMIFALELSLDDELAFKMLSGLAKVLSVSDGLHGHIRKAQTLGLVPVLDKFYDNRFPLRIIEMAQLINTLLGEEQNSRGV